MPKFVNQKRKTEHELQKNLKLEPVFDAKITINRERCTCPVCGASHVKKLDRSKIKTKEIDKK